MVTPVILIRSLNVDRGGVTKASLKRANMFAKEYKEVIIITTLFQSKHKQIINELRQRDELADNVIVYNFFEDLRQSYPKPFLKKEIKHFVEEKDYITIPVPNHPNNSYRFYKDGFYKMYKRFKNGQLYFIDYMNESGERIQRSEYDENGFLVRERFMDTSLNKPRFDKYYDFKGECMLSVHVNPQTEKERIAVHFDQEPQSYNQLYYLQAKWINRLLKKYDKVKLFCEWRDLDPLVYRVKHVDIKKIAVIHSSHLKHPFNEITSLRPGFAEVFLEDKYDNYVFLTEEQKNDVESVFKKNNKYKVIPHSYEMLENTGSESEMKKDPYLAIYIARYAADKRIDEAIQAFAFVVKQLPEAKLHLYGNGPLKKELQTLIKKLNLQNNVFLKGYTNNPARVYKSAACSIITSRREGFGMVITESMGHGTPVIAYDFKYGPRDIINHNVDGIIVENGNREQLAESILLIMTNDDLRSKLSKNALSVKDKFSEESYREAWLSLLRE